MQSPYQRLLLTNEPPSQYEDASLRQLLAATRATLQSLPSADPRELELERLCRDCELALSPIRHLPRELVAEVILLAWGGFRYEYFRETPYITLDIRDGLWAYSQVCSAWRKEILSRSSIWANISLLEFRPELPSSATSILTTVLSRTANQPLRLILGGVAGWGPELDLEDDDIRQWLPQAKELTETVALTSSRWRTASICLHSEILPCLRPIMSRLPILEFLNLSSPFHSDIASAFADAPALRHLSVGSYDLMGPYFERFPWLQITHFSYATHFSYVTDIYSKYLLDMPQLVRLELAGDLNQTSPHSLLILPKVTSFRHYAQTDPDPAYSSLKLPSATEITVFWDSDYVPVFIKPSDIHTLFVRGARFYPPAWAHEEEKYPRWMEEFTSVKTLHIVDHPRKELCDTLGNPKLFPKLDTLVFDTRHLAYLEDVWGSERIRRLVQSRRSVLREVAMVVGGGRDDWELCYKGLLPLKELGLAISLRRDPWDQLSTSDA